MNILERINNLIAQKGEGFYCILTDNNEITDIFKVASNSHENMLIQTIGNRGVYSQEDIARMIEQEGAGDRFVFLNDIISVPEQTDQEIADQWKDEALEAKVIPMGTDYEIPERPIKFNEPSAADLIGRENMDYTN
jgi:hypothetical protein